MFQPSKWSKWELKEFMFAQLKKIKIRHTKYYGDVDTKSFAFVENVDGAERLV